MAVEAPSAATVAELARALAHHIGDQRDGPLGLFSRRLQTWLRPEDPIGVSGLRSGDALVLGTEGVTSDWDSEASRHLRLDLAELLVTGGPQSGTRFGLPYGEAVVGRDGSASIVIDDPSLSREHFRLQVEETRVAVSDVGSRNGTSVEGVLLRPGEAHGLRDGDVVEAGRSLFTVRRNRALLGVTLSGASAQVGGRIPFNRPPRIGKRADTATFNLDAPPDDPQRVKLPLFAAAVPLVIGVGLYLVTHNILTVAFIGLSGVMALYSYVEDRRGGAATFKRESQEFETKLADLERRVDAALVAEATMRRAAAPPAVELAERALDLRPNLWERRRDDEDFLELRVGAGTQPSFTSVELPDAGSKSLRMKARTAFGSRLSVPSVPVTVTLPTVGAIGCGGSRHGVDALGRWLVLQSAVLHSPRDVVVAAAIPSEAIENWSWLKWLPHTHSDTSPIEGAHIAADAAATRDLLQAVCALVRSRRQEAASRFGSTLPSPAILLVVDERVAPERATIAEIFGAGPEVGIYGIWLGSRGRDVPGECEALVELADDIAQLTLTKTETGERYNDVTADGVPKDVAREVALALAPVRDTSERGKQQMPSKVSLLELLGFELSAESILQRWRIPRVDRSAVLGADSEGAVHVDLRQDGPHGLVAGTTGSGKSELLQTLVAGLAADHPPSRLTFLLVDCKGGAAFSAYEHLAHTVGFVTDLDEHLTRRALVSLNAELRRREAILREAGAHDLQEMEERSPDDAPPSLLIVIDEFAALVREVPEFVSGVVDVAQRGRSLGLHLILATQSPNGVVDDKIKANTNLRIALRMNSASESADVLDTDDAARIARSLPGRAFVKTGHEDLRPFQAAYVGGTTELGGDSRSVVVRELSFDARSATQERMAAAMPANHDSDLKRIVSACQLAAESMQLPALRRPWLDPLPETLLLGSLPESRDGVAVVGLVDAPALQQQSPYEIDFDQAGSALVYGATGSGKTSLLFALASSLAASAASGQVEIYGLDFASRMLSSIEVLPQCGSVIPGDDDERVNRLFTQLRREVQRRKDAFSAAGVFSLDEYRDRSAATMPRIFVLLDGYAGFVSAYEKLNLGELVDLLPRLVADGRPLGIHFVITADRRGAVPGSLASIISRKIVLRMADDDDYASLGLDLRAVRGATLPAGRGFIEGTLECQIGLLSDDGSSEAQTAALVSIATALEHAGVEQVSPIGVLPTTVSLDFLAPTDRPLAATLGVSDQTLDAVTVDVADGHFLVAGPFRSGRSTALAAFASGLANSSGVELVLLAPRRSPLPSLPFWSRVATGLDDCEECARDLAAQAGSRNGTEPPIVVVVDDADNLLEGSCSSALDAIVRLGRDRAIRVVAAAETQGVSRAYSGWLRELRKDEQGLLLDAQSDTDGELLGVRLPRRNVAPVPGRGYLVQRGETQLVQTGIARA